VKRPASLAILLLALLAFAPSATPARAKVEGPAPPPPTVDVVKVEGVIDPALSAYVRGSIESSESTGATVILQVDARGAYGDQGIGLARFISRASVPVVAWIGPSGARASGGALLAIEASLLLTMAPGAGIGPALPLDSGTAASRLSPAERRAQEESFATVAGAAGRDRTILRQAVPAGPALDSHLVAMASPTIPDLLRKLDGRSVPVSGGSATLATLNRPGRPVDVSFHEIGPVRRVLHGVSTPAAVYVLLVLGVWGVAFELTQPGFGVSGIAGAVALALAGYGLSVVPVHWVGVVLILGGMALQGLDVLLRRLAWLTGLGSAAFVVGSVLAWRGTAPPVGLPPWLLIVASVGALLFFGFGLTVAMRARERIQSAQVGLVGLVGEVRTDLAPEGGVYVKGSLWRARSMNGPIPKGRRVRVRGIDGLILRVQEEPDV